MLEIHLMGGVEAVRDGRTLALSGRRVRALLAALALSAGRVVSVEALARAIWDDDPPARVRGSLQTYIGRLRRVLGDEIVGTEHAGYVLRVERSAVDLLDFADSVDAARGLDEAAAERTALSAVLDRWHGEPFGDAPSDWFSRHEAPAWTERHLQAFERRIDLDLETGTYAGSLLELGWHAERNPLRETLWVRLLKTLDRVGRTAEALERYEMVRRGLADELGVDPSPELRDVYARLLERTSEPVVARSDGTLRLPAPRQLPPAVGGFVGREHLLGRLDQHLGEADAADEPGVFALHGLPGSGKTTLAIRWAQNVRGRFPDGQLFLNLQGHGPGDPVDVDTALGRLLQSVGVPGDSTPCDTEGRAELWRSTVADRRLLIVLDNARDADAVRPLLPGGPSVVVVTSRSQLRGLAVRDGAQRVPVDRMSPSESLALLTRRVGRPTDPADLDDLADLCGHLPVALAVAAERVDRSGMNAISELRTQVERGRRVVETLSTGDDPATNIRSVLNWSYRALDEQSAQLFRFIGLWRAPRISLGAAAALAAVSLEDAAGMLDRLTNQHLLSRVEDGWYEAHDLIRELASEIVHTYESDAQRAAATGRLRSWFLHSAANARSVWRSFSYEYPLLDLVAGVTPHQPESAADAHGWFDSHATYLEGLVRECIADGDPTGHLLAPMLSAYYQGNGVLARDGQPLFELAEASAERLGDPAGQAVCANSLAQVYFSVDDAVATLDAVTRARDLYAKAGLHDGELCAQGNAAIALVMLGRTDDAIRAFDEGIIAARRAQNARQLGMNLLNQSDFYRQLGRTEQAAPAAEEAVEVFGITGDTPRMAYAADNLGDVLAASGRLAEAIDRVGDAVELHRAARMWSSQANSLRKLGILQRDTGRPDEALACWRRAVAILHELGLQSAPEVDLAGLNSLIEGLSFDRAAT